MLSSKLAVLSLFSLGGIGFVPFFMSADSGRKLEPKSNGNEAAVIDFEGGGLTNPKLKGKWVFLNKKKHQEAGMFDSGVLDVVLPVSVLSSRERLTPAIPHEESRILYCRKDKNNDAELSEANSIIGTVYCKDLSDKWAYGKFEGKQYSALFAVVKKNILKNSGSDIQDIETQSLAAGAEEYEGKLDVELMKILKLATKTQRNFNTDVHFVNTQIGHLLLEGINLTWCGEKMCFLWGNITTKNSEGYDTILNCDKANSLTGCTIKFINISR